MMGAWTGEMDATFNFQRSTLNGAKHGRLATTEGEVTKNISCPVSKTTGHSGAVGPAK